MCTVVWAAARERRTSGSADGEASARRSAASGAARQRRQLLGASCRQAKQSARRAALGSSCAAATLLADSSATAAAKRARAAPSPSGRQRPWAGGAPRAASRAGSRPRPPGLMRPPAERQHSERKRLARQEHLYALFLEGCVCWGGLGEPARAIERENSGRTSPHASPFKCGPAAAALPQHPRSPELTPLCSARWVSPAGGPHRLCVFTCVAATGLQRKGPSCLQYRPHGACGHTCGSRPHGGYAKQQGAIGCSWRRQICTRPSHPAPPGCRTRAWPPSPCALLRRYSWQGSTRRHIRSTTVPRPAWPLPCRDRRQRSAE